MQIISDILLPLGGGASIVLALSAWLGNIWAKRLLSQENNIALKELADIKHRQNLELQETLTGLNKELESFKNSHSKDGESQKFAYSAYMSAHSEYVKKRIDANELLWEYILEIRSIVPSALYILDAIKIDNPIRATEGVHNKERIRSEFDEARDLFYSKNPCMTAQSLLPYLDPRVYRLYVLYKSLCSRFVWYGVLIYHKSCELDVWYEDMRLTPAIEEFSRELEGAEMYLKRGCITAYIDYVESMISNEIRMSMNGQNLGEEAAMSSSKLVGAIANFTEPQGSKEKFTYIQ
ncbi:hypothetical protein [Photobacterium phosphoreum]|uniref:hypothetical protein n=1 Tax=Photobacterium phosphoreum TaxID=659 RepID=UPI001E53746D|nr:hypothetical protein [Photobacterium phosphoreum]MCD9478124.1 hypothetical protein [Photobacterium phosphoreum]